MTILMISSRAAHIR